MLCYKMGVMCIHLFCHFFVLIHAQTHLQYKLFKAKEAPNVITLDLSQKLGTDVKIGEIIQIA